jgi:hypothetical protein
MVVSIQSASLVLPNADIDSIAIFVAIVVVVVHGGAPLERIIERSMQQSWTDGPGEARALEGPLQEIGWLVTADVWTYQVMPKSAE